MCRLSKALNFLDQPSKTLEMGTGAPALGDRRLYESYIQWREYIWDGTTRSRICHKKAFGEVLSGLYRQLQAFRPKVSYSIAGYLWNTRQTFEGVEEDSQADKMGKNGRVYCSIDYIDQILEPCLEPWYKAPEKDGRRPIYMQDGALIHSSAEVHLWLRSHKIEVVEWPPKSPDLDLTEDMWKGSKGKIRRCPRLITNEKDIFEAASREWEGFLERKKHVHWISTMKDRCKAVIKNRGFATGY